MITVSCAQSSDIKNYPAVIGDIEYDPALDDPGFKVCNVGQMFQYYGFGKGLQFRGEKIKIEEYFRSKYKGAEFKGESGYVIIRFIVNCEGSSGRFRVQEMGFDYQQKTFPKKLTTQLLMLTQNLDGWLVGMYENQAFDYYQHLIFKIEDGKLTEILP
jgi:hypothetical protein